MSNNIFLSDDSISLLREFAKSSPLPVEKLKSYPMACIDQLSEAKLIESHITGYDSSNRNPLAYPIFSDYAITETGKAYIEDIDRHIHEKRWENVRYAITTAISILALVLAGISLAAQLGLIQLPSA